MTKNYYSVNGEILGDSEVGDYMRDALGSVTGTTNPTTGAVQNTYRYKPFGDLLAKTGASPDPQAQWKGTQGYQTTGMTVPNYYAPGRWYASSLGYTFKGGYTGSATLSVGDCGKAEFDMLGIKTAWEFGGCGYYTWCGTWKVGGLLGRRAVIVQCVDRTYALQSCKDCDPIPGCQSYPNVHFCEYWEIGPNGRICHGDCKTDPYKDVPNLQGLGSIDFFNDSKGYVFCKGSHEAKGVAKLFLWDDLPPGWEKEFGRPAANVLPERQGGPPGWFATKPLDQRTKTVSCPSINCCPPNFSFTCTKNVT